MMRLSCASKRCPSSARFSALNILNTLALINDVARMLATCGAANIWNGISAVQLSEAAVAAGSRENPDYLHSFGRRRRRDATV